MATPPRPQGSGATIDRLYDEVTGMRDDVTGMRADLRELTVTVKASAELGRDHEHRLREFESGEAPVLKTLSEQLEKVKEQQRAADRRTWIATGVGMTFAGGGASFLTTLLLHH